MVEGVTLGGIFREAGFRDVEECTLSFTTRFETLEDYWYPATHNVQNVGRFYQNLTDDFSAQLSAFKGADVEIVTGVVIPPDWTTFWTQAKQQGYTPKPPSTGISCPVV